MSEYFYNFQMGGQNAGYYYLRHEADLVYSYTRFFIGEDNIFVNIFQLKIEQDRVLAYKYRDDAWVDFSQQPAHVYPSSAYPLFLPKAVTQPYTYTAIQEGEDIVVGKTVLTPEGNEIVETREGNVLRRFTLHMQGDIPSAIDWGGPISHLCASAAEAIEGSGLDFVLGTLAKM